MEYQKFIPEGWQVAEEKLSMLDIKNAMNTGKTIEAKVLKCDDNFNLHIGLGNSIKAILPKDEFEIYNDIKPSILKHKENDYVQFKVTKIEDDNRVYLSRKAVKEEAINWVKNDLKPGDVILRNCKKY